MRCGARRPGVFFWAAFWEGQGGQMKHKDALLRVAVRLHERATSLAATRERPLERAAEGLLSQARTLEAPLRRHQATRLRGWTTAAERAGTLLRQRVVHFQYAAEEAA